MHHTSSEFSPPPEPIPVELPAAEDFHPVAVLNRASSNYPKAIKQFKRMQQLGYVSAQDVVHTHANSLDTVAEIGDTLTAGTSSYNGLVIITGDGGANTVAGAIHQHTDTRIRYIPSVYGQGGGACDLHTMTQGFYKDYLLYLPKQRLRPLFPIEATVMSEGKLVLSRVALNCVGVGLSPRLSDDVNSSFHRKSPLLGKPFLHQAQEYITGMKSFISSRRIYVSVSEDSSPAKTIEWIMVNGNRMGRQNIFPGDIHERGFYEAEVPSRRKLLMTALRLYMKHEGVMNKSTESKRIVQSCRPGQDLLVHFDGETAILQDSNDDAPVTVEVKASTRPIYVATQRAN